MNELTPSQAPLFPEWEGRELLTLEEDRKSGKFTGERVARNQARYKAIVSALAEGLGTRQIARAFQVSPHVVALIREKEAQDIATLKEAFAVKAGRQVHLALERIEERLLDPNAKLDLLHLSVVVEKLADKWLLLKGEATQRIVMDRTLGERLRAQLQAEIIDVEAATPDSESGSKCQKAQQNEVIIEGGVTRGVNQSPANGRPQPARLPPPVAGPGQGADAEGGGGGRVGAREGETIN